ncbi:MAG: division/cell wall cluster transcriptional repressor MraZ [Myxococcota bacterium]
MPKGGALFRGAHEHSIDDKGRTSVPAAFREILAARRDARLIVTPNFDDATCLVAFPPPEWETVWARIAALPRFDDGAIRLRRLFVAEASECAIDPQGRLLIPPLLRAHAGLEREIVWAGTGREMEIWDKRRWLEEQRRNRAERAAIVKPLPGL